MRAETLRDLVEQKINERWLDGLLEDCGLEFGSGDGRCCAAWLASALAPTPGTNWALLDGVKNTSELARIGTLIIDCESGQDFLARARR